MAEETLKKRYFKVIEKDLRLRETAEYPGKKVKKKTLVIGQEICVIKSQEFIYKDQVLIFYLLKDRSGWVIDYSPGAKKRVLKEVFRTAGDEATAALVQEKLHHLRLRMQLRMKRVVREKAFAQRDLNIAVSQQQQQHKLLREARTDESSGSGTSGIYMDENSEQLECLNSDLGKSDSNEVNQNGEGKTINRLLQMLANSEARAVEAEKKLVQKCNIISELREALNRQEEGEESCSSSSVFTISQQPYLAVIE